MHHQNSSTIVTTIVGGLPDQVAGGHYLVSNQGVGVACRTEAECDDCVERHKRTERLADIAWLLYVKDGGFTVDFSHAGSPRCGYAVSRAVFEERHKLDGFNYKTLYAFLFGHDGWRAGGEFAGCYVCDDWGAGGEFAGCYVCDGWVFLDVCRVYADRSNALRGAERNDQAAIYDLAAGADIDVRYAGVDNTIGTITADDIGRKARTRCGDIVEITIVDDSPSWPVETDCDGLYTRTGGYDYDSNGKCPVPEDLVEWVS